MTHLQEQKNLFEIISSAGLYVLMLPLGYILRVIYANNLTIQEVGLVYSTISILTIANVIADFGINQTIMYFGTKLKNRSEKLKKIFWQATSLQIGISLITTILLVIFAKLLTKNLEHELSTKVFTILILFFLLNSLCNAPKNILAIFRRQHINYFAEFFRQSALIGFSIFATIYFTLNIVLVAWSWVIMQGAYLLILLQSLKKNKVLFSNIKLTIPTKEKTKFTIQVFLANIIMAIYGAMDIIIITYFLGLQKSAIYSTSLTVNAIFDMIAIPITAFVIPIFANMNSVNFKKWSSELYKYVLIIIMPFAISFIIFAHEYLQIIFGNAFTAGKPIVQIIAIFAIFKLFIPINFNLLIVKELVTKRTKIILLAILFNIIGSIIFIKYWGLVGVSFVIGVSWMLVSIMSFKEITMKTKITIHKKWIFFFIISNALFTLLVLLTKHIHFNSIVVKLLFVFCISYITYLSFLLVVGNIEISKVKYLGNQIFELLHHKMKR